MAETENAAKRAREGPKGPVKPDPVQAPPEQESEARARTLVELLRSQSAAAAPPPSENGNGHANGLLSGSAQRAAIDGNGNGSRAVQPADLRTLQRLAGNAAVADLMAPAPSAGSATNGDGHQGNGTAPVQRAAIGASPPGQVVEPPERKAAERGAAAAVMAWIAAAPTAGTREDAEAKADQEKPEGAEGGQAGTEVGAGPQAEGEGAEPEAVAGGPAGGLGDAALADAAAGEAAGEEVSPEGEGAAEGELGPGREAQLEAQETLERGRAERAEAMERPQPQTMQLVGPSLPEALGASAAAAAASSASLGLAGPIAGLAMGAAAESATSTASTRRAAGARADQASSGAATTGTQRGGRSAARSTQRPASSRRPTPSRRATRPPQTRASSRASAARQAPQGSGPAVAPADTAAITTAGTPGAAAAPEVTQAPNEPNLASPPADAAAPPPPPAASPPQQGPQRRDPGAATSSAPAASGATTARAQDPTLHAIEASPHAPSDPSRPSPAEPSVQPAPEPSQPSTALTSTVDERAARAVRTTPAPPQNPLEKGFKEQRPAAQAAGPGGGGRAPAAAAAKAAAKGGGGGRRGGGGARRSGGGGGGGGGGAPVPLGDAALEQWRSASSSAISDTEANELTEAKEGPGKVEEAGQEIDSARKGEQPDYEADAKEQQPSMPAEPDKDQVLDTGPAEAAVKAVITAGDKRLADQTFAPLGTPPPYKGLNPIDYVPRDRGAYKAMKDLEKKLAGEGLSPSERVRMTKELEARKKQVQEVGEKAQKGTAAEAPPTVVDEGPASLKAPDPAMGDVMGDVIARELGRVGARANEIRDAALTQIKGKSVPAVSALGDEEASTVKTELDAELNGIATAAGVTKDQLTTKIAEQKKVVTAEEEALKAKLQAAGATATKQVEKRATDEGEKIGGAKAAVDKGIKKKKEALSDPPDTTAIEKKRNEFIGEVEKVGAQALAGLKSSLAKRESALDSTGGKQKASAKQAAGNQANAIRRHWVDDEDPNKGMVEARPTAQWGTKRAGAVDTEVSQKKTASKTESDALAKAVTDQIKQSRNDVRDWAARQEGRERSWWEKLWDAITDWSNQAEASNEAWEKQRNADTRDKMAEDFDVLTKLRERQAKEGTAAATKELGAMDAEQQKLANLYLKGGISSIEFVARSTIGRIKSRRVPELSKKIEQRAIAELGWEDLGTLAKQQGNKAFDPGGLGNKIRGAVSGLGTDEAAVYAALGQVKTNVERAALNKFYQATYGTSLEADVKGDMSGHELDRALALKEGRSADAEAAALAEALEGWGTDEDQVRNSLRGKTPEEIKAIKEAYLKQTGRPLDTDLRDDMEDAELDNALALSSGNQDAADAAELQVAMEGMGTDEAGLRKVYERIREEEEARAKREGLTPAELKASIQERNSRLKKAYNDKYGAETGGLDVALKDELDDADAGLMTALDEGDATKIDAARANREHESFWYADDDEIEKIARNQHKQADLEVNLELAAEKARLRAMADQGIVSVEDYKEQSADFDKRFKDRDKAIAARAQKNMGDLKAAYSEATNGTQTFDQLVLQETQGYSQLEIQDLVAAGGKLSDEKELYYATAGVGTDEDKIKEIFKGKTPKEIAALRAKYKKNLGRDMDDDVMSDLSGRENLDVGHTMKYGDPDTFAKQLAEAKSPADRKKILADMKTMMNERKAFEETGVVGSIFAAGADPMNSAAQLEQALQRAEDYDAALSAYDGLSDEERAKAAQDPKIMAAKAKFDMNFSAAKESQEQVRKQIDAYTDAAVQVGAAVVAVVATIVTAGALGPAFIAAYGMAAAGAVAAAAGAAAGTLATMGLKYALKGDAYGWEEFGADAAIGAVDAVVSAATAGAGKFVMRAAQKAIAKLAARKAAKKGAEQVIKQGVKTGAKEGLKEGGESATKVWFKEAGEEAIEGALGGAPTAAFEAAISDDTWKSDDPFGAIMGAGAMGGAMGGGMGVGFKGLTDAGGAGIGWAKGKMGSKADVDAGSAATPNVDSTGAPSDGSTPTFTEPEMPDVDIDLPPTADPGATIKAGEAGELPPGVTSDSLELPPGRADVEAEVRSDIDAEGGTPRSDTPAPVDRPAGDAPPARNEPPEMRTRGDDTGKTVTEPGEAKGKPSEDDVGKPLSTDELETRYGMPGDNVKKIVDLCDAHDVIVDIRPTTPHAEPLLSSGKALPKPEKIKAKTLNEVDVMIGLGSDADLGKVFIAPGFNSVDRPANYRDLSEGLRTKIDQRIKQRREEFAEYWFELDELTKPKVDANGKVQEPKIRIDEDGLIVNTGLKQGGEGLPFTGDHDIFDIRARDGSQLPEDKYKAVVQSFKDADVGVEHGSVIGWKSDAPETFKTEAYEGMMANHSKGGSEPLVRFGEGEPKATWFDPADPPAGDPRLFSDAAIDQMLLGLNPKATRRPEGAVEMLTGPSAGDLELNMDLYRGWIKDDPYREVGLLYNADLDKYAVVQGAGTWVNTPGKMGNKTWMEDLLGDEIADAGPWRIISHSHPVELGNDMTPERFTWPSGKGGDMEMLAWEAKAKGGPARGQLEYTIRDADGNPKLETLDYGYREGDEFPYWIKRRDFHPGEEYTFKSIDDYEKWYWENYPSERSAVPAVSESSGAPDATPGSSEPSFGSPDRPTGTPAGDVESTNTPVATTGPLADGRPVGPDSPPLSAEVPTTGTSAPFGAGGTAGPDDVTGTFTPPPRPGQQVGAVGPPRDANGAGPGTRSNTSGAAASGRGSDPDAAGELPAAVGRSGTQSSRLESSTGDAPGNAHGTAGPADATGELDLSLLPPEARPGGNGGPPVDPRARRVPEGIADAGGASAADPRQHQVPQALREGRETPATYDPDKTRTFPALTPEARQRRQKRDWSDAELAGIPPGDIMQLPGASRFDSAANHALFERRVDLRKLREVALLYNTRTGQYAIVQGQSKSVKLDYPEVARIASDTDWQKEGWVFLAHSHPIDPMEGATSAAGRWPSMADWNVLTRQALKSRSTTTETRSAQASEIKFWVRGKEPGPARLESLVFSYDPNEGNPRPFQIIYPVRGQPRVASFPTVDAYNQFLVRQGIPLQEIPRGFRGRRDPDAG